MKRILIIAAHPDDEILGCGGTMARYAADGSEVHIMILAEGLTSRDALRDAGGKAHELSALAETAREAGKLVGATEVTLLAFPDNRMDSVDLLDVIKPIEQKVAAFRPDTVFTHHAGDLNIDHHIINQAVQAATRPQPGQAVRNLLFFEIASSTEWQFASPAFAPNFFVALSETDLQKKVSALKMYESEMRPFPHSRSIQAVEALARWRGASVGAPAAEAFVVGRIIQ